MSSADARLHVDHTGFYRGILAIGVVAVPAFGLIDWDLSYDSFAVRLAFAGAALAAFVGSYTSAVVRRNLRLAPLLLCYGLFTWFAYIAYRHDMQLDDIFGILPVVIGVAVVIRRPREIAILIGYIAAVLAVAFQLMEAPAVSFGVPFSMFAVFAGILGWMSVWRARLEDELQVANATLEARVAERTALLEREIAERLAAEQRSNAANEAKSRFLANMSHELRTPLNAVIGYTELVEQELADSDQAHHCKDLDKVGRAAKHLLTIIDDILDLSRVEVGSRALGCEPVAVHAVTDDAVMMVRPAIDAHRDRLTVTVARDLVVAGDREALVRVLVHLLDNAAKFTADGTITIAARRVGDEIEIEVRDTGIGIPEAARAQIFERFTQADDSSTRNHGGVGLGLAICRELVARMRGTIAVASAVGEGTAFTVRLPAA
ncbi:MAG: HAMP domain-containing histidine kinase [Nannocystis sp.]|nr:HAMP domain-containing sensor histidine kinase [Nannocystis sp.]MBA3545975.1 HAMP domain-containing histidine kinase [Nannocystis sp.]